MINNDGNTKIFSIEKTDMKGKPKNTEVEDYINSCEVVEITDAKDIAVDDIFQYISDNEYYAVQSISKDTKYNTYMIKVINDKMWEPIFNAEIFLKLFKKVKIN